jgi:hypothetical protein
MMLSCLWISTSLCIGGRFTLFFMFITRKNFSFCSAKNSVWIPWLIFLHFLTLKLWNRHTQIMHETSTTFSCKTVNITNGRLQLIRMYYRYKIQEHLRESETNPNATSFLAFNLWCCVVVAKKMITFTYLNNSTYTYINLSFIYIYPYII